MSDQEAQDPQAQGEKYKAGGCDVLDQLRTIHASLQVSRALAYQGISPVKTEGYSSSEGTRARARPLNAAGRDAMSVIKFNNTSALHPALGYSGKNTISVHPSIGRWKLNNISRTPLHPSVGRFKRDGVNLFDFECAGCPRLEASERRPVTRQKLCRGPALAGASLRAGAKTSMF